MKPTTYKIIIGILVVLLSLLTIRVVFDEKFDNFNNFIETRENYEGGPEKFDEDFKGLVEWEKQFRKDNPNATDADVNKAFKKAWGK